MEKVLLIDVALDKKFLEPLQSFGMIVESAQNLTDSLMSWPDWENFDPSSTLIVLPGNGASILQGYLPSSWLDKWRWLKVYAKRYWIPGEDPRIVVNRIYSQKMLLGIKDVVILDDVISSGKTCKSLRVLNEPWIPGAHWHAVTWLMQESSSTKGFSSTFAVKKFGTKKAKAPINSLSTLLQKREIAVSYSRRNFPEDQSSFLELLDSINQG